MKKLSILIAFLFCAIVSYSQLSPVPTGNANQLSQFRGGVTGLNGIVIWPKDTLAHPATPSFGALTVLPQDAGKDTIPIWMSNGFKWIRFNGGGAVNINDTIYARLPIYIDTISSPGKRVIAYLLADGLISGGVVTVDSCMTLDISAPVFIKNYKQYQGVAVFGKVVTTANPSLARIDRVVVDTNLNIIVLPGTPSLTPVAPPYNTFSQTSLAEIPVGAGVTCLAATQTIIFDGVGDFAGQYIPTTAGTGSTNFINTAAPFHLLQASFTVTYSDGYQIIYTKPSGTDTAKPSSILKGFVIFNKGLTPPNQISAQWFNGTTAVSTPLLLNTYVNVNDSNVYQMFVIPLNAWQWPGGSVFNKLVLTFGGNDNSGAKGIYLDYLQLQTGIGTLGKQYVDSSRVISNYLYDFYNGIGVRRDSISGGGGAGWLLIGNAATDSLSNFVGTTDNVKFNFRVNNALAGSIGTATTFNVSLGATSLPVTSSGIKNTGIGGGALGLNTTGSYNTGLGYTSNYHNTTGERNTALGWAAIGWNIGTGNTAVGNEAFNSSISSTSTGDYNTALGNQALLDNFSHDYNIGIGVGAGQTAAQDSTLYISASSPHMIYPIDTATGAPPALIGFNPVDKKWHHYNSYYQTLQQTFNTEVGGSVLTKTDTIQTGAFGITMLGSNLPLLVRSSGNYGIYIQGLSGSTVPLTVESLNQAIIATSTGNVSGAFESTFTNTNSVQSVFQIARTTTGTAANGIGGSTNFLLETSTVNNQAISNSIISKWTTATLASRVSEFSITGVDNAITGVLLTLAGSGAMQINKYNSGVFDVTDTTTYKPTVMDASGNVRRLTYWTGGSGGGGGSGINIYNTDSLLASDRTVDLNGKVLKFTGSGNDLLTIDPVNAAASLVAKDNGVGSSATFGVNGAGLFAISADDNLNPVISIVGNGGSNDITFTSGGLTMNGYTLFNFPFKLKVYTVATLPSGNTGDMAYVSDALAPTYNATVVGTGAVIIPVFFNGTNWVAH